MLWLATEEHRGDVTRRFRELMPSSAPDTIRVHVGPIQGDRMTVAEIDRYVTDNGIGVVIVDSLSRFWPIQDENDARQVAIGMQPLLDLAHERDVAVLVIHHAKKGGAESEDAFRGSSDLLALADIGVLLRRDGSQETRRVLSAFSRFIETPSRLLIDFDRGANSYRCLGSPEDVARGEVINQVMHHLAERPDMSEPELRDAIGCHGETLSHVLRMGFKDGALIRTGKGRKGEPYHYSINADSLPPSSIEGGNRNENPPESLDAKGSILFPPVGKSMEGNSVGVS